MKRAIKALAYRLAPPALYAYLRLLRATLRIRYVHRERLERAVRDSGHYIMAFWHGRLLLMPFAQPRGRPATVLASLHRDAQLVVRTLRPFGFAFVAGSSTRGGRAALREMVRRVREGNDAGIAPDGPRGPRRRVKPGVIALAQATGLPILPVACSVSRARRFDSWDKFVLPRLFARGAFVYGEPLAIPHKLSPEQFESWRLELERCLNELTDAADRETGLEPEPPLEPAA